MCSWMCRSFKISDTSPYNIRSSCPQPKLWIPMTTSSKGLGGTHPIYPKRMQLEEWAYGSRNSTSYWRLSSKQLAFLLLLRDLPCPGHTPQLCPTSHIRSLVPCAAQTSELESPSPSLDRKSFWDITVFNSLPQVYRWENCTHGHTAHNWQSQNLDVHHLKSDISLPYLPTSKKTTNICFQL